MTKSQDNAARLEKSIVEDLASHSNERDDRYIQNVDFVEMIDRLTKHLEDLRADAIAAI